MRSVLLLVLALAVSAVPATATDPVPEACTGRAGAVELAADEVLVERILYFTGNQRVGNVDGSQSPRSLRMTEEPPTGSESKVYASRTAGVGNAAFAMNQHHGHFTYEFERPARVVCARATFWATSGLSLIPLQLFVDASPGVGEHEEHPGQAAGAAGHAEQFVGPFRRLDTEVSWDLTLQFNPGAPGAAILYDSAEHPSSLRIVTVEKG